MKTVLLHAIAMTFLVIAVIASGCTGATSDVSVPETTPVTTPTAKPSASGHTTQVIAVPVTSGCANPPLNLWTGVPESYVRPADLKIPPEPGSRISMADLFGTPSLSWTAYTITGRYTSAPGTGGQSATESNIRTEIFLEEYLGKPATHKKIIHAFRITEPIPSVEQTTIEDTCYDDTGHVLNQHRKVTVKGEVYEDHDIAAADTGTETDCSGALFNPVYTYEGIEPVKVPVGSFPDAMKYISGSGQSATVSVWFAKGIPVEVKKSVMDPGSSGTFTMELAGWG